MCEDGRVKRHHDDLQSSKNVFDEIVKNHPHPLREPGSPGKRQVFSQWSREEMNRQFSLGETIHRISVRFDCHETTVMRFCNTKASRESPAEIQMTQASIQELRDQGLGWEAIGRHYGVDSSKVRKVHLGDRPKRQLIKIRLAAA